MAGRTIAIGDIHGDLAALDRVLERLPPLDAHDTIVFLGDYVDRGPDSAGVIHRIRHLDTPARVVALRGNHEDGWLRVARRGDWDAFVTEPSNGCLACLRSYEPGREGYLDLAAFQRMRTGGFFPPDVLAWMEELHFWYEDEHAIYVHAGLVRRDGRWLHPMETEPLTVCLWTRDPEFFSAYVGKRIVVGHTPTARLPPELCDYSPGEPDDVWIRDAVCVIDTRCGKGGFLSALVLPEGTVIESR